ncbi:MAG: acyl-CoA dehydrogenase [Actinobacteria bacterium]|jgi:alkylation response protein AidB-like acyl-CoA dehydrogenase|nr:acyl-CoA dehydrogenase [Actinomycetota bacterium]
MDLSLSADEQAFADEFRSWLDANLDLPPSFDSFDDEIAWGRTWQAKLAADRWVGIHWPSEYGGRSASPVQVAIYNLEYGRSRALQLVNRTGVNLAGPTLLAHGTEEQKARWLPSILDAAEIWCQLFSEPEAGSDLAGLRTTATPVEGGWVLNGQKVWTSYAQYSRWGICLARTDTELPKHKGISYLVVDMEADGVEIRPLRQITGDHEFNEVFFTDAFVPENHLIGGLNNGWAVANTTLAHERGTTFPFKEQVVHEVFLDDLYRQASAAGTLDDPAVAEALVDSFVELRVLRLHNWRTLSRLAKGIEPGPESSWIKLAWTDMTQHMATTALDLCGPAAPLWRGAADLPGDGKWQRQWLWSKAGSIAGGTSEVQKNIVSERILGLPRG